MNAPAEAFRCQSLAKEIAAELRTKNIGAGDGIRTHDPNLGKVVLTPRIDARA
jgi:hypothetical protein